MARLRDRLQRIERLAPKPGEPDHYHVMNEGEADPTEDCELCKAGHVAVLFVQRVVRSPEDGKK
ncbi:hypothetical protein JCM17478_21810 [Thermopirellula anaerolimosa]